MQKFPDHVYAVILAGGSGTRFWPKSRHLEPKQLCKIGDSEQTMLVQTLQRFEGLIPRERRLIITHQDQMAKTQEQTQGLCQHYIAEPAAKNTAHALALAALEIRSLHAGSAEEPLMISVHADALIRNEDSFQEALRAMLQTAQSSYLSLLGITPEYPETGYGYIEKGQPLAGIKQSYAVQSFREKPDRKTASNYLQTGKFLWNSGIFAWRIDIILSELERFLPDSFTILQKYQSQLPKRSFQSAPRASFTATYAALPSIAIDHAILEKSDKVSVVEADIGWKDLGSWDALAQSFPTDPEGHLIYGDAVTIDCQNLTIDSDGPLVAALGVHDLVIVASKGAILVCPRDRAQEVKKVVDALKAKGRQDLI